MNPQWFGWWLSLVVLALACEGATAETPRPASDTGTSGDSTAGSPGTISAARVVAVGDLHGDLDATLAVLRLAKLIDGNNQWSGGRSVLVQTGDQLDRGDDEPQILALLADLERQAPSQGGRVVVLNGNHEVMNVQGDFRYVTEKGFSAFSASEPKAAGAANAPGPLRARAEAFLPGGQWARRLALQDVIATVGDTVFVHGGVLPEHVRYGVDRINREVRAWMRAEGPLPEPVAAANGPIWTRAYSSDPTPQSVCAMLADVLKQMGARRMVVGHTVQKNGITSACGGAVYRIDVGLARYYGSNPIQALEIESGKVRIVGGQPKP